MDDLSWGGDDADDLGQYGPPGARDAERELLALQQRAAAETVERGLRANASNDGIIVTAHLNGNAPLPRQTSGENHLAAHRPTRYALIMRRNRANASRVARKLQQWPAILPGDCEPCRGLGVVNGDRQRCPVCRGSGER